jgi:hypothetical protein
MSFVPPGYLTPDQLVDLVVGDKTSECPSISLFEDLQAYMKELRAQRLRAEARRVKAFAVLQAPLYKGRIEAIILKDGREYQVPQSVWGKDDAALTFMSGYATFENPLRRHGRVFFNQANAEEWLDHQGRGEAACLKRKPPVGAAAGKPYREELISAAYEHFYENGFVNPNRRKAEIAEWIDAEAGRRGHEELHASTCKLWADEVIKRGV